MIPQHSMMKARVQHVLNRVRQNTRDASRYIPRTTDDFPVSSQYVYCCSDKDEACGVLSDSGEISHVAATGKAGLGTVVLNELERLARKRGLSKVRLSVFDTGNLVAWYVRHGYRVYHKYAFDPKYNVGITGTPDVFLMEKAL